MSTTAPLNTTPPNSSVPQSLPLNESSKTSASIDSMRGLTLLSFVILILAVTNGCNRSTEPFDLSDATYVGQQTCVSCHKEEAALYAGSHHDQAMQIASDETVLGNFDNATFEHHGVVSRLFREGEKFMVHTEGPDGQMRDFEVKYVFGVEPLQQYMVELPAAGQAATELGTGTSATNVPRVQVLRISWDTAKQEWFYLAPPDVDEKLDPTDDLHWTGIGQRWNNMCAECHSTDYQKQFKLSDSAVRLVSNRLAEAAVSETPSIEDLAKAHADLAGRYTSSFMEINVSCEACHGPGSVHVNLAGKYFPGWNRERGYGLANLKLAAENQIQACAPCHSRRNVVQTGFQPGDDFYDHYANQLLTEDIYYPDGQILDEDYVHGSFIQSKMYHKGIKCTDCHDPHSARLKHDGNQVCTSCHQHPAAKYDSVAHHFHKPEGEGAKCVNCHMPATTYMALDARRDHSFRIPRPDLSTELGTPNACTGCHLEPANVREEKRGELELYQDWMLAAREGDEEVQRELERVNAWCDQECDEWYGENRRRDEHFGIAIAAGQQRKPGAPEKLQSLLSRRGYEAPAVARATALQVLSQVDPAAAAERAARDISDDHPLVRGAAANALTASENATKSVSLLQEALSDPVRSVRTEAVRNLLQYPQTMWRGNSASAFRNAVAELEAALESSNDSPNAHLALGIMAEQQGRNQQAIKHYEAAIALGPLVTGARTNLAALLERSLSSANSPSSNTQQILATIKRLRQEELPLLKRDADLLPDAPQLQYRLGLALYLNGQRREAAQHLVRAAEIAPDEPSFLQAAAMIYQSLGEQTLEILEVLRSRKANQSDQADSDLDAQITKATKSADDYFSQALNWCRKAIELSGSDPANKALLDAIQSKAAMVNP